MFLLISKMRRGKFWLQESNAELALTMAAMRKAYLPLHPLLPDSRVRVPVEDDRSLRHSHKFTEITNLRVALPGESIKRMWQLQDEKREPVVVMQMQVMHDNKPISEDTFVDGEGNVPLQHCMEVKDATDISI